MSFNKQKSRNAATSANMATSTTPIKPQDKPSQTSSRFLGLPREVRLTIYDQLFEGSVMEIEEPTFLPTLFDEFVATVGRILPPVLIVCRQVRAEALPIFAMAVVPTYFNSTRCPSRIPNHYLNRATKAVMKCWNVEIPPIMEMPNLALIEMEFPGILRPRGKFSNTSTRVYNHKYFNMDQLYAIISRDVLDDWSGSRAVYEMSEFNDRKRERMRSIAIHVKATVPIGFQHISMTINMDGNILESFVVRDSRIDSRPWA